MVPAPTTPRREQPVIMVSAPRSGSTLLQRILNTHPEVTIWGEHMGILADFRRAMAKADAFARNLARGYAQRSNLVGKLVDTEPFSPHINPFDMEILHAAVKDFIVRLFAEPLPDNTTWGFKEVRYFADDLEFFAALFPAARFIVLVREPVEQMSSYVRAPWRQKPDLGDEDGIEQLRQTVANAARGWTRQYESLRQFASRHKDASMVVRFDELIDESTLVNLFAHIALAPPDEEGTRSVLARPTGSSDKSTSWTAEDRAVLDDILAGTAFPPEHDDVLSFYFGDGAAASRTVSPPPVLCTSVKSAAGDASPRRRVDE